MNKQEYIAYHMRGDAGIEGRVLKGLCEALRLTEFDRFCLAYFYSMTYNIDSALRMLLEKERNISNLKFRTDRRFVRCNGTYNKLLQGLTEDKLTHLNKLHTTQEMYDYVHSWNCFGRYTTFLFLEDYLNIFEQRIETNLEYGWEPDENYTKGAIRICGSKDKNVLNKFLADVIVATGDNEFSIETSLCAVEKIAKGTRFDDFYRERLIHEMKTSEYSPLVMSVLR